MELIPQTLLHENETFSKATKNHHIQTETGHDAKHDNYMII